MTTPEPVDPPPNPEPPVERQTENWAKEEGE